MKSLKELVNIRSLIFIFLIHFVTGCSLYIDREETESQLQLNKTSYHVLPGWHDDEHGHALRAFSKSCLIILKYNGDNPIGGQIPGFAESWFEPCKAAIKIDIKNSHDAKAFFEKWFTPYLVSNNDIYKGLFTGYFEPEILGSMISSAEFGEPIYKLPVNLITANSKDFDTKVSNTKIVGRIKNSKFLPYYTRKEINVGISELKGQELVWVKDPIDVLFLHIQGSGRILFEDGSSKSIGYAGSNGHPYYAIGRSLVTRGEVPKNEISMQRIRKWLLDNPNLSQALINENKSYIFFKWNDKNDELSGPIGSLGIPLTAGRSLAVDRQFLALGVPIWLETEIPQPNLNKKIKINRLVIAQDTGSAIKGPIRGDLFIGTGVDSGAIAGLMKESGRYWVLLPKQLMP